MTHDLLSIGGRSLWWL